MRNYLNILTITTLLSGCSGYGGEWPKLNAPLPDPDDRQRVIAVTSYKITPYDKIDSGVISYEQYKKHAEHILQEINKAWSALEGEPYTGNAQEDTEDKQIAWMEKQIALSRLSAKINELRELNSRSAEFSDSKDKIYIKQLSRKVALLEKRLEEARDRLAREKP